MSELEGGDIWGEDSSVMDAEILLMNNDELTQRIRLLDNDVRIMRSDVQRITHESSNQKQRI